MVYRPYICPYYYYYYYYKPYTVIVSVFVFFGDIRLRQVRAGGILFLVMLLELFMQLIRWLGQAKEEPINCDACRRICSSKF